MCPMTATPSDTHEADIFSIIYNLQRFKIQLRNEIQFTQFYTLQEKNPPLFVVQVSGIFPKS